MVAVVVEVEAVVVEGFVVVEEGLGVVVSHPGVVAIEEDIVVEDVADTHHIEIVDHAMIAHIQSTLRTGAVGFTRVICLNFKREAILKEGKRLEFRSAVQQFRDISNWLCTGTG